MPYDELQKSSSRMEELLAEIDDLETRWLELQG